MENSRKISFWLWVCHDTSARRGVCSASVRGAARQQYGRRAPPGRVSQAAALAADTSYPPRGARLLRRSAPGPRAARRPAVRRKRRGAPQSYVVWRRARQPPSPRGRGLLIANTDILLPHCIGQISSRGHAYSTACHLKWNSTASS